MLQLLRQYNFILNQSSADKKKKSIAVIVITSFTFVNPISLQNLITLPCPHIRMFYDA